VITYPGAGANDDILIVAGHHLTVMMFYHIFVAGLPQSSTQYRVFRQVYNRRKELFSILRLDANPCVSLPYKVSHITLDSDPAENPSAIKTHRREERALTFSR
jgi:hypothetical protein